MILADTDVLIDYLAGIEPMTARIAALRWLTACRCYRETATTSSGLKAFVWGIWIRSSRIRFALACDHMRVQVSIEFI